MNPSSATSTINHFKRLKRLVKAVTIVAVMLTAMTLAIQVRPATVEAWDPEEEYQSGYLIYDGTFRLGSNFRDDTSATGSRTIANVADPYGGGQGQVKQIDYTTAGGRYVIEGFRPQGIHTTAIDNLEFTISGDWANVQLRVTTDAGSTAYLPISNYATFSSANIWETVTIPVISFTTAITEIRGITWGSTSIDTIYLDDIRVYKTVAIPTLTCGANQLGGTIFLDPNMNGVRDATSPTRRENGVAGILVSAYDDTGFVTSNTSDSNGHYQLSVPDGTAVRLEFTNIPTWHNSTANGPNSNTSVIFTTSSSNCNVDFGIQQPAFFCGNNPTMVTSCFVSGDASAGGVAATGDILVSFPYDAFGDSDLQVTTGDYNQPDPTKITDAAQNGSIWGLAYQKRTGRLFTSSFLKRHSSFGPEGTGGIYVFNTATNALVYSFSITNDLGVNTGVDPRAGTCVSAVTPAPNCLQADGSDPSYDVIATDEIGKRSLGDIDLSDNDQTLWVINLVDKTLYEIPVGIGATPPTTFTAHPIVAGDLSPACPNNDFRPFAVKVYQGLVYVGVTCTAETSQNNGELHAYILSLDPAGTAGNFQPVFDFALGPHGQVNSDSTLQWNPWSSTHINWVTTNPGGQVSYPQPLVADIEFDVDGSMVIGILDRFGHQSGANNYSNLITDTNTYDGVGGGDILRVCNNSGTFQLESNGVCPNTLTPSLFGTNSTEGPNNGEFYWGDSYPQNAGHRETGNGGLALLHGSGQIASTVMDPLYWNSGGILWLNNTTGADDRAYELFRGNNWGKSTGLGDLEIFCDAAPLEIGNRVWLDVDDDGIQDPGEVPLSGIVVELYQGPTLVATATTNATGQYYFIGQDSPIFLTLGGSDTHYGVTTTILPETGYEVRIDLTQSSVSTYTLTQENRGTNDLHDSDGIIVGTTGVVSFTTGTAGQNNHAYDFGFTPIKLTDLGDLPDIYGTTLTNTTYLTAAVHVIAGDLYFGSLVDNENEGQPNVTATGDDNNGNPDDEDGIIFLTPMMPGQPVSLRVTANVGGVPGTTAQVGVWLDFNGDGLFNGPAEFHTLTLTNTGTALVMSTLTFNAPSVISDTIYSRFRIASDPAEVGQVDDFIGAASTGEVEDYALMSLGNTVWADLNNDRLLNNGELGLPNIDLILVQAGTITPIATTTTNGTGNYLFTGLLPGDYEVIIDPTNFQTGGQLVNYMSSTGVEGDPDTDQDDNDDNGIDPTNYLTEGITSAPITLALGGEPTADGNGPNSNLTVDFGLYPVASIGDLVWFDADQDGIQDGTETLGIANVAVQLFDSGNTLISTTTTASNGTYLFSNLPPGDYYIQFTPPTSYTVSPQDQSGNDGLDSDVTPATNQTIVTTLTAGENDLTWDMGLYVPPAEIGDLVWLDSNANGIQDGGGETGIDGVTVNLYQAGSLISTTTTANGGLYLFANLVPGDYYVEVIPPTGYGLSPQDQGGNDTLDSDINPATGQTIVTALDPNESDLTWDAGIYPLASIGDLVWYDSNQNGIQDNNETAGVANVTVQLFDSGNTLISTTTTAADGSYLFDNLPIGDYYLQFTTPPSYTLSPQDQGGNDTLDSDINPATGQTIVTTLDPNESDLTWDAGLYAPPASIGNLVWFDNNQDGIQDSGEAGVPGITVELHDSTGTFITSTSTLNDGTYQFTNLVPGDYYVQFTIPPSYTVSLQDQGSDDAVDSDVNPSTSQTIITTLGPNEHDPTWDMGIYQPASIGDLVWYDIDGNGVQDVGEQGIPNVTVNLYQNSTLVTSTTTLTDGTYLFTNLTPSDYSLEFVPPTGYLISTQNQGSSDALDSDADPSTGQTITTTLASAENDLTWDAGMYPAPALSMTKQIEIGRVVPQQQVTYTIAVSNTGGVHLNDLIITDTLPVSITFVAGSATPVPTSINGQTLTWSLTTLPVGQTETFSFLVDVAVLPNLTILTNVADSVAMAPTGPITTTATVPVVVEDPAITVDKQIVSPGIENGVITFTIRITNTGPSTMVQVPLFDTWVGPVTYVGGTPPADIIAPTPDGGRLAWNDLTTTFGDLASGQAVIITTIFEARPGITDFSVDNDAIVQNAQDTFGNNASDADDNATATTIPTDVVFSQLEAVTQTNGTIKINWDTTTENNTFGFYVYRATTNDVSQATAISNLISAQGAGSSYSFIDPTPTEAAYYWLQEIERDGTIHYYGPIMGGSSGPSGIDGMQLYLPTIHRE